MELNNEIEETLRETIFTVGVIEGQHSKEVSNHPRWVAEYSSSQATIRGLPHRDIELIPAAVLLHEIGKLGTPDEILFKPGK